MADGKDIVKGTSLWADAWKRLLKNKLAVFGLIVLAIMVVAVIIGPYIIYWTTGIAAADIPAEGDLLNSFPPSLRHPMGTDEAGRDILARVLQGGRISLMVGIISTIVSLIIGVSYGAIAGYLGGGIDNLMMRIVDIIYSIPYILVVIVLLSVFGGPNTPVLISWLPQVLAALVLLIVLIPVAVLIYRRLVEHFTDLDGVILFLLKILYTAGVLAVIAAVVIVTGYLLMLGNVGTYWAGLYSGNVNQGLSQIFLLFFALGLVSWLTMARVVRGQVLSLKNQEFVLAARATGVSTLGIIFKHLVPNTLGPVIVYATLTVPSVMLTEAFLSFLGLGVQAPYASWGSLASDGIKNIAIYPWQMIFPGVTMALTLFSLNFVGDGLRDALDPQTRKF
ncbi:MAG TPA: ABC transporter permease [Pyrinomonadaceae bacterium]|jgi:oligopeptide transport system permease protein